MKFAAFTVTFFLLATPPLVSGAALRTFPKDGSSKHDDGPDFEHRNLGQLRSEECAPMMEKMNKKFQEMVVEFTTEELKDFACNAVARKRKTGEEKEMEKDITTQTDTCIKALEREMLKNKELVLQAMGSKEACEEELTKAVEDMESEMEAGTVDTRGVIGLFLFELFPKEVKAVEGETTGEVEVEDKEAGTVETRTCWREHTRCSGACAGRHYACAGSGACGHFGGAHSGACASGCFEACD